MRQDDFERMIRRMEQEVPAEFLAGVAEIAVSPRTVPHPARDDIFTLGECIPLPAMDAGAEGIQSRVVLYHGSFQALARIAPGFDWRAEAWETLTHELRHHLEWRARAPDLEAYDRAAEHNFARQDGDPFDPVFFLDGEPVGSDCYRVDDDVFVDLTTDAVPSEHRLLWRGRVYRIAVPRGTTLPALLTVEGLAEPPEGELVLVLRRRPGLRDLLRRRTVFQAAVHAEEVYVSSDPTQIPQR
ncbi:MAG TPA: metallopeptidase family protein [Gemmatimonadales bacterium]|nr:metallopeptidase family protein [Gemmatimonadales bacterium]